MDLFFKNYKCYIVFNQACVKIMKCCTIRKEHLNSLYSFYQDFFSLDQFLLMILFHIILILKITFMKKNVHIFHSKAKCWESMSSGNQFSRWISIILSLNIFIVHLWVLTYMPVYRLHIFKAKHLLQTFWHKILLGATVGNTCIC